MKRYQWAISIATAILLAYGWLHSTGSAPGWLGAIFGASPIVVLWVVYEILRSPYHGPDLGPDEAFGYQDRDKNQMGTFY